MKGFNLNRCALERLSRQALGPIQCALHVPHAPSHPTQRARQLDVQPVLHAQHLQARRLLGRTHHRLDLAQGAREPCARTVRQEAAGAVTLGTVPAGHPRAGRRNPLVGAVTRKTAAPVGMQGTARKRCAEPTLLRNLFRAGESTLETQLHRPPAVVSNTISPRISKIRSPEIRRPFRTAAPAERRWKGPETTHACRSVPGPQRQLWTLCGQRSAA